MPPKKRRSSRLDVRVAHYLALALFLLGVVQASLLSLFAALNLAAIENTMSDEDLVRGSAALSAERESLLDTTREFAAWNDTRDFVLGGNGDYVGRAFGPVWLSQAGMDALAICDLEGRSLHTWYANAALKPFLGSIVASVAGRPTRAALSAFHGGDANPLVFAAWPVTSDDFMAPPVGWMIMVRELGGPMVKRLGSRTGLGISVQRASASRESPRPFSYAGIDAALLDTKGMRTLYLPLEGLDGRPAGTMLLKRPRRLDPIFHLFLMQIIGLSALVALVSSLATHRLVRSLVVRPLERIGAYLEERERGGGDTGKLALGALAGRQDEVGAVADHIDTILDTLENRRLELSEANRKLARLASLDPLTGLANRRSLEEHVQKERRRLSRMRRQKGIECSTAILLCDIDFFKLYNDSYGHQAGDECLRAVAGAIQGEAHRPADLACRYGGEEFLVLLPGTDIEGGRIVAARILEAVAALALPHGSSPIGPYVTVSVGVSSMEQPGEDEDFNNAVRLADEALYKAKKEGRNRIA